MMSIPEADWKLLRRLQPIALERFCTSVLSECAHLIAAAGETSHQRYLKLFGLIQERDAEVAEAFNDVRRSTAWLRLSSMRALGLITDEEFGQFSPGTRAAVARLEEHVAR